MYKRFFNFEFLLLNFDLAFYFTTALCRRLLSLVLPLEVEAVPAEAVPVEPALNGLSLPRPALLHAARLLRSSPPGRRPEPFSEYIPCTLR